jgi:hypothetical protein
VENAGLWEIFADPACPTCGSESLVRVPVDVPAGGKLLLSTNASVVFTQPSSLSVAGELELQGGSRLRLDSSNPARDLSLLAGSVLNGTGRIQLEGNCRMVAPGDLDSSVAVVLNSTGARLIVPGTYTVRADQNLIGAVDSAAVVIASNATLTASSAAFTGLVSVENGGRLRLNGGTVSFGTNVTVNPGGRWDIDASAATVVLNGALTNNGAMRWISHFNTFDLQGSGRVENLGSWEVFADPACPTCGGESVVRVPVIVPAGGKLLLTTNGFVNFTASSSLSVAGELELLSGARLRLDSSTPARDLTLAAGSVLSGAGTILLEGGNRVALTSDVALGTGLLDMTGNSSIAGAFTLTLAPGSTLRFDHSSTLPGSLTVNGTLLIASSSVTLTINGILTLQPTGILNNPGTVRVGAFVNNAPPDNIIGNAPVAISGFAPPQINGIQVVSLAAVGVQKAQLENSVRAVWIEWIGAAGQRFVLETSSDLKRWQETTATVVELVPGSYQARLSLPPNAHHFFRLRLVQSQMQERRQFRRQLPF